MSAAPDIEASAMDASSVQERDAVASALEHSELYRGYRRAFESTVGLPLELRRADSFQFPLAGSPRQNPFCALMARRNKSCAACLQLQQRLHDNAPLEATTLECAAGLRESAVPVRVGDVLIAFLRTGQVFVAPPSRLKFVEALHQSDIAESAPDSQELEAAYFQTRVMAESQYHAALTLLKIFAHHLGTLANRLLVERAHAELPVIAKARAYIAENIGEQIRLEDAAHAASMSAFYFCKLFRRVTGLTFTQYLARVRVEVVKQRLLNPNIRVCEAAYATGFQSLSQFNRVFRRVAGETPMQFRSRVPIADERRRSI